MAAILHRQEDGWPHWMTGPNLVSDTINLLPQRLTAPSRSPAAQAPFKFGELYSPFLGTRGIGSSQLRTVNPSDLVLSRVRGPVVRESSSPVSRA